MSETLNIDERIAEIDASIEAHKLNIEKGAALARLKENPDFQLVFIEGYFDEEANRVFNRLLSPVRSTEEERKAYLGQIESIRDLLRFTGDETYPGTIEIIAKNSKQALEEELALKQELIEKGE